MERGVLFMGPIDADRSAPPAPETPVTPKEHPPLRFETVISAIPDLPDLRLLREALVDASHVEAAQAWSGGARLSTLDKRAVDLADVESRIPELADRVRRRAEAVMTEVTAALRAIGARDEASACRHLVAAGEVEEAHHRLHEAGVFYAKAAEIGRRPRDRSGESLALLRSGRVARARGELGPAFALYRAAWEIAEATGDVRGSAIGTLGVGHVLADQGRWVDARTWYLRGMERLAGASTPELIHLCNALSVVERRMGDLAASREWLARGEAEAGRVADAAATAHLEHGRGKLYLAEGDVLSAEAVFREALARPLPPAARVVALLNLAESLRQGGNLGDAESAAREAEGIAIANGDLVHLPHVYLELGELAGARGDADGFVFFEQALDMLGDRDAPPLETATVQRGYGLFEARFGRSEAAAARLTEAERMYEAAGSAEDAERVRQEHRLLVVEPPNTNPDNDVKA